LLFSTTEDPLDSTLPSFFSQYPNLLFYSRRNKTLNSKQQQQQQRRKENNGKNTDAILRPSFKTPPRQTTKKHLQNSRHETARTNRTTEGRRRENAREGSCNKRAPRAGGGEATGYLRTETG